MPDDEKALLRFELKQQNEFTLTLAQRRVDLAKQADELQSKLSSLNAEIGMIDVKGRIATLRLEELEKQVNALS
jgi:hypothetical protein